MVDVDKDKSRQGFRVERAARLRGALAGSSARLPARRANGWNNLFNENKQHQSSESTVDS